MKLETDMLIYHHELSKNWNFTTALSPMPKSLFASPSKNHGTFTLTLSTSRLLLIVSQLSLSKLNTSTSPLSYVI